MSGFTGVSRTRSFYYSKEVYDELVGKDKTIHMANFRKKSTFIKKHKSRVKFHMPIYRYKKTPIVRYISTFIKKKNSFVVKRFSSNWLGRDSFKGVSTRLSKKNCSKCLVNLNCFKKVEGSYEDFGISMFKMNSKDTLSSKSIFDNRKKLAMYKTKVEVNYILERFRIYSMVMQEHRGPYAYPYFRLTPLKVNLFKKRRAFKVNFLRYRDNGLNSPKLSKKFALVTDHIGYEIRTFICNDYTLHNDLTWCQYESNG